MRKSRIASILLATAIVVASVGALWRMSGDLSLQHMGDAVRDTPAAAIALSLLATLLSFACLAYYDRFATEAIVPGRIGRAHAWLTGAVSHAFSNTLGFPALTGTALRYRLYRQRGVATADIARLTLLVGLCVALGSLCALCLALLFARQSPDWARGAAMTGLLALLGVVSSYPAWSTRLRLHGTHLPPIARNALLRPVGVGLVEAVAAIGALYVLLPEDIGMPFAAFVALASGAMLLGVLSHAPGGIGVFETTVLAAFPVGRRSEVLTALLLYRVLYNLLPFTLAGIALGVQQARAGSVGRRITSHEPLLRQMQPGQRIHADGPMARAAVRRGDAE